MKCEGKNLTLLQACKFFYFSFKSLLSFLISLSLEGEQHLSLGELIAVGFYTFFMVSIDGFRLDLMIF